MSNMVLGDRVKSCRKDLGLTLQDVARELGVAKSTVQRYESGSIETIKLPVFEALARILRVAPDYLLGRTDEKKPPVNEDDELTEYLEELKNRSEMRMLFKLSKGATKEDVEQAVKIIEALRK